jgi:flagellar hook assembly protein FlgD
MNFNVLGKVQNKFPKEAGYRSVQWDATDMHGKPVSTGVYLYQIRAGEFVQTKKMVLLK